MSRQSVAPRNLTLTEELEKLEQSITLTLQEIDHNFSKAHRIVTTGILPLVEQYGEHSRAFWKQFFESSANVSLSGYEDQANGNEDETSAVEDSSAMRDEMTIDDTADPQEDATRVSGAGHHSAMHGEESMLDDAELAGSTPRPPASKAKDNMSNLESPYEAMRREMDYEEGGTMAAQQDSDEEMDSSVIFAQHTARLPDISTTPRGLPNLQSGGGSAQRQKDPLLHRVLDKTYRIQATPHKSSVRKSPVKGKQPALPQQQQQQQDVKMAWHDSPMSSPEIAIPTLRSEAFMTPFKSNVRQRLAAASQAPRTPGVSVQTPAAGKKTRDAFAAESGAASGGNTAYEIDWESDEDDNLGMSPPKTIQFALPPSKLLQTPAREASRRIVDDILLDAGAGVDSSEYSPSMVKMNEDILNDSF
ncbi:DASH complex subunit ask1 [Trichoderma ghanense]|uniref:DASH complex subunit ASK1 n=1 Tax=Trichoderma ghanense TaxID=65468 RepID=A0ABY2H8U7_9HYPO